MRASSDSTAAAAFSSPTPRSSSRHGSWVAAFRTRSGPRRTSGFALVLVAAGLLVIGLWNVPAGLFAGTIVLAFGHALCFPSLLTLAVSMAPAGERSAVVGTFTAFSELGFLVGSLSLGAIASTVGYGGMFVVCATGPLLGALVLTPSEPHVPLPSSTQRDREPRARAKWDLGTRIVLGCGNFGGSRLGAGVLRSGGTRRSVPNHGRCLGARDHVLRHRRRVRRWAERDVDRRVARREGPDRARRDHHRDEDLQPHGGRGGSRALAPPDPTAGRDEPQEARARARPAVRGSRARSGHTCRGDAFGV